MHTLLGMLLRLLAPATFRHELTLEQHQELMRQRLQDQEQRLQGLKTELQIIRRDVAMLIDKQDASDS